MALTSDLVVIHSAGPESPRILQGVQLGVTEGRGRLRRGIAERRERLRSRASEAKKGPADGLPAA